MTKLEMLCEITRRELGRFNADESGATAVEYALIAGGVSVAIAGVVMIVGSQVKSSLYEKIASAF